MFVIIEIQTNVRRMRKMDKLVASTNTIFSQFINDYPHSGRKKDFKIYPQMPTNQILHYLKIAARKKYVINIQLKPSKYSKHFIEITGKISLSNRTSHIVLNSLNEDTVHLVQADHIHHVRIAN